MLYSHIFSHSRRRPHPARPARSRYRLALLPNTMPYSYSHLSRSRRRRYSVRPSLWQYRLALLPESTHSSVPQNLWMIRHVERYRYRRELQTEELVGRSRLRWGANQETVFRPVVFDSRIAL